jgi:hypothetical protein
MDRGWFTERMLQTDIAVMVLIVIVGIMAVTSRLTRDPSESMVRWWQDRVRTVSPVRQGAAGPATAVTAAEPEAHAPEWLERLIGRNQAPLEHSAGRSQGQPGPDPDRRVA